MGCYSLGEAINSKGLHHVFNHFLNKFPNIMEPITTIIATAIAMGAADGIKPTVSKAIKDSYEGLKKIISDRYGNNDDVVDAVEYVAKKPEAEKRRGSLSDALEEAGADKDEALIAAAKLVHETVQTHAPELPESIGVDIGVLKAKLLEIENVQATPGGTGVRIGTAEIDGVASFKSIGGGNSNPK